MSARVVVHAGRILDEAPLGWGQLRIFVLCSFVGLLDGVDTQSIGIAARPMAADLSIAIANFGPLFAATLLGAAIGAVAIGALADRFGRKRLMIVATVMFGCFTLLTARAPSMATLLPCRFAAGVGLGGAVPCFLSLGTEYAPLRWRQAVTAALWTGFPLGGMLGALLDTRLLVSYSWRSLFYVGGAVPLILAACLALWVPESVRYLVGKGMHQRVSVILGTLRPRLTLPFDARFTMEAEYASAVGLRALFEGAMGRATTLLWIGCALLFGTLAMLVLWTPSLLGQVGLSVPQTAAVIAFYNLGGLLGTGASALLVKRFGTGALVPALVLGGLSSGFLGAVRGFSEPAWLLTLAGLFLGASAGTAISWAGSLYPAQVRSAGIGGAMGAGRLGQFAGPLAVGVLVGMHWPVKAIFAAIAVAPMLAAIAMACVGFNVRHLKIRGATYRQRESTLSAP
jgi:AAHS family 4-hydroxybenzoate transporter-like MFS transporter